MKEAKKGTMQKIIGEAQLASSAQDKASLRRLTLTLRPRAAWVLHENSTDSLLIILSLVSIPDFQLLPNHI